jgi:Ca2+-binding EF-hand superfamily protein
MSFPTRAHLPLLAAGAVALALCAGAARAEEPPKQAKFFETYDADRDGKVTKAEFDAAKGDAETFRLLDQDGDGVVLPAEVGLPADFKAPPPKPAGPAARPGGAGGLRRALKEMDKDGDQRISKEEFTGPADRFARFDRNADGFLDAADLQGAPGEGRKGRPGAAGGPEGMEPGWAKERFRELDKDGDGKLAEAELPRPELLKGADVDGDGALDEKEYTQAVARARGPAGEAPGPKGGAGRGPGGMRLTGDTLKRFDGDRDGKVTREEFPGSDERFRQCDRDGDGVLTLQDVPAASDDAPRGLAGDRDGNGRLSREEFPGSDDEWRRLDKNTDGWIDAEEEKSR